MSRKLKLGITISSAYSETYCTFCRERIHDANTWLPSWVSELIGKARFGLHRRTAKHKGNRPTGELAPAPTIDPEAFEKRAGL